MGSTDYRAGFVSIRNKSRYEMCIVRRIAPKSCDNWWSIKEVQFTQSAFSAAYIATSLIPACHHSYLLSTCDRMIEARIVLGQQFLQCPRKTPMRNCQLQFFLSVVDIFSSRK